MFRKTAKRKESVKGYGKEIDLFRLRGDHADR